ncbi:glycosyl transferase family 2 [Thalassospira marina]|uniref:Glycosyl transferase family 2 n=1 Tax=Thalassospira marina TaxID=2048283 RepID=A0A2N3KVT3_9PROT|nr:glycosyl transferase family 2 [Thalassospira marina]
MGAWVPDISYVLPVYNKAAVLPFFIRSLREQSGEFSAEYIFVDDASSDASLFVLRAETAGLAHVKILENTENKGPAIRLNQGAKAATGDFLVLFDCDEVIAPNAVATLLGLARRHGADMVHGKWHKTADAIADIRPREIPAEPAAHIHTNPFKRALGRGLIRMTWLVERSLFANAGGCDEQVFIQDESLPLRLASQARCLVDTDAVVTWVPDEGSHLSDNKIQQHHDRFMTFYHFLRQHPQLDRVSRQKLGQKCISAARKALRDGYAMPGLKIQIAYFAAKAGLIKADGAMLDDFYAAFNSIPTVRRPISQ